MIESSLSDMDLRKASWLSMADADGAKDLRSGVFEFEFEYQICDTIQYNGNKLII